jgi:2-polyprenyl-6-methoxyphenol hydroxylase-like FAD-dependent oxidoreductase
MGNEPQSQVPMKTDADVIIIGAGPIGLLLANLLGKRGLRVIVAERRTQPPKGSMAIGITPPSLNILKTLSLDSEFVERGIPVTTASVFENSKRLGDVDFSTLPSEHRCILSLPQATTLSILRKQLKKVPSVHLLEGMQFIEQEEGPNGIRVRLQDVNTSAYADYSAAYLVGCDGYRSAVRNHAQIPFPGHFYRAQFFMADFRDHTAWESEARLFFGVHGSVESFPLSAGMRRWIIQVPLQLKPDETNIGATVVEQVDRRIGIGLSAHDAVFESFFRPQRHVAATYVQGRVLLCGDAAHVMSPIGGQGMNTGFADAAHLARAIAGALETPEAAPQLFGAYTRTRKYAFNVAASRAARGMWLGTRRGRVLSFLRQGLIGHVLFRPTIRKRLARYFAMLTIPGNNLLDHSPKVAGHVS